MVWGPHDGPQGPPPGRPGWPSPLGQPTWPSAPGQTAWSRPYVPPQAPAEPAVPEPPADADPFTRAEHAVRATIAAPWWRAATPVQRQQALLPRLLSLPDHSWWLYGAWARWYRWHPADGRWFPAPPPRSAATREAARPGQPAPMIAAEILPTGPDFAQDYGLPLSVTGSPVSGALLFRLRSVVAEAAQAPPADYPLGWSHFLHGTPSTVAATWSSMLWCASVPVFDPDLDLSLLGLWEAHLAQPLGTGRLRWLPPPPLHTILSLYAERLRAGRPDAANQLVRCMVMTAQALRDDPRFRIRAAALLSMIEPLQANPALDHRALPYGDQAVEREWHRRCAAPLAASLFADSAPGECFQLAFYDFATALTPLCGDTGEPAHLEPRHAATALLAADMAGYRPDLATPVGGWLDPELRALLSAVIDDPAHELRRLWPAQGRLPDALGPDGTDSTDGTAATIEALSGAAATAIAWTRLAGGIPLPPDGFTVANAFAAHLDGL
ncbi:hypothetical protein F8566_14470 [Actinomadura rudentiformis]|uniref:Uncharacterized protein n=1 Tax=Actinomadura rudentiformis TaxID=359158 RepID=A0A6H9Z5L6_9ACTN|nr:hypothetical protein F8566_14470 [Actinomadura rudentiformis]